LEEQFAKETILVYDDTPIILDLSNIVTPLAKKMNYSPQELLHFFKLQNTGIPRKVTSFGS